MRGVKLVLFDVGNVIIRSTHAITYAILWDLGVRTDKVALFFHNAAYGQFARGKITGKQFARTVGRVLEAPALTEEQIRAAHDAHIYMVDPAVVAILKALKAEKIKLGFVTTTNKWQTEREKQLIDLKKRFGPVVRSHDIGLTKIDNEAWREILGCLRMSMADLSEILFIDDSSANTEAAGRAGIQTHLYDPTPIIGARNLRKALRKYGLIG